MQFNLKFEIGVLARLPNLAGSQGGVGIAENIQKNLKIKCYSILEGEKKKTEETISDDKPFFFP